MRNNQYLSKIENKLGASNGTLWFVISALFAKVIGAVYKVPLFAILGENGVGLYQMVFPVYALLLTVSVGGIPLAMTKLISSGYDGKAVLLKCLKLFIPLGAILGIILFFFGKNIAILQGNVQAFTLYKAIAPSVVFVCVIACLRGYFQGGANFKPTAFSQLIEQLVKAVSGVIALLLTKGDYKIKALYATFAVTFSELIALIVMLIIYKKNKAKECLIANDNQKQITTKILLSFVLPITASSILLPLASFADSFIAINALKNTFGQNATAVYGIYSGGVDCIIAFPITLLHCLSVGFLPKITFETGNKSIAYIFFLSVIGALAIILFAPLAINILFANSQFKQLAVSLLRFASLTVVLHSTLHAVSNLLLSAEKQRFTMLSLFCGVVFKFILNLILIKMPSINIFGMIISEVGCYFVALTLNLLYIKYMKKKSRAVKSYENNVSGFRRRARLLFRKGA